MAKMNRTIHNDSTSCTTVMICRFTVPHTKYIYIHTTFHIFVGFWAVTIEPLHENEECC